jgi:hypothetical protein
MVFLVARLGISHRSGTHQRSSRLSILGRAGELDTFNQGAQAGAILLRDGHRLGVQPERHGGVGVPHLTHDVGRVLAERDQQRGERAAQRVRAPPRRVASGSR